MLKKIKNVKREVIAATTVLMRLCITSQIRVSQFSCPIRCSQTHVYSVRQVWDLTWLCDVLVTPHTVVTTDNEPGG